MAETLHDIEFDDKEVQTLISGLIKKTDAITKRDQEVIGILSSVVFRDIMQHFERGEGPDSKWKEWSPRYTKFMTSIGRQNNQILIFNGRLRINFQPTSVRKTADGLLWFNNAKTASGFPYAAAHDEGGPQLPQRKFMWLSDSAISNIEEQIIKYLEK